jgi:hypothetical protein
MKADELAKLKKDLSATRDRQGLTRKLRPIQRGLLDRRP